MNYSKILVTGGAGFVGSSICLKLKEHYSGIQVVALDNLVRRGSELNIPRLKKGGVEFLHGDVRNKEDLTVECDLIIECSAEPSVMAGVTSSPEYLINTNLVGAINCFELARKRQADVLFLSTSRVYPIQKLNSLNMKDTGNRFELDSRQSIPGASKEGISESFPLNGKRSLYGATKLSAELLLAEYIENYKIRGVIDRFGVISGPWQMGKVDQGVVVLWMARHFFKKPITYIGFGGKGKQVRDVLHVDDVFDILNIQINSIDKFCGKTYNIGGGRESSISLKELTEYCQKLSGNVVEEKSDIDTRPGDVRLYITDNSQVIKDAKWHPVRSIEKTLQDVYVWISENKQSLKPILE